MNKIKFILLTISLTGCIEMVEIPVQFNTYACTGGWQYTLTVPPEPIIDDQTGEQLTCKASN